MSKIIFLTAVFILNPCEVEWKNEWLIYEYYDHGYLNMSWCQYHKRQLELKRLIISAVCR